MVGRVVGRVAKKTSGPFDPSKANAPNAFGNAAAREALFGRLRRQFVALLVAVLALVLVVTFAIVCVTERQNALDAVDAALESALQQATNPAPDAMPGMALDARGPEEAPVAVAVYVVADDGSFQLMQRASSGTLSREDAAQAVDAVLQQDATTGSVPGIPLLFAARDEGGFTFVAFASQRDAEGWVWLAWSLAVAGVLILLAAWALGVLFARRALAPVKEAWERQDAFIADASHELKTPVSVILANDALLRAHPERTVGSQMQWVDATHDEALRLQSLIGSLLELARFDAGSASERPMEEVDLSYVTEGEALQFESVAFERALALETAIEPQVTVAGDADQLRGLVRILLDNACKYACAHTVVTTELFCVDGHAVLRVTDRGVAIDPQQAQRLFDRFYRADAARTRPATAQGASPAGRAQGPDRGLVHGPAFGAVQAPAQGSTTGAAVGPDDASSQGGFGLGLAIAAETVRRHGGTIRVLGPEPALQHAVSAPASLEATPIADACVGDEGQAMPAAAPSVNDGSALVTFEVRLPLV